MKWSLKAKLCAGSNGAGALIGDSGSALTTGHLPSRIHFAQGLLSQYRGSSEDRKMNPDVYTLLADNCEFISRATRGEVTCHDPYNLPKECSIKTPEDAIDE